MRLEKTKSRLLLDDNGAAADLTADCQLPDLDLHQVTAP
jgi:hypothetical protein